MLTSITLLTAAIVAVLYPLCFWASADEPLKGGFHRFHLGLPLIISGVFSAYIVSRGFPTAVINLTVIWMLSLTVITFFYWKREFPDARLVSVVVALGVLSYIALQESLIGAHPAKVVAALLGGAIFCATLFAMNLGHWYLNVHGLPVKHLVRSTYALGALLGARLLWDLGLIFGFTTPYRGRDIALHEFILTLDGFLLLVALFFGVLFPLFSLYFVLGTLKLKNTQSATGILYVTLCSVLLGDLTYKYYLIKFGIPL